MNKKRRVSSSAVKRKKYFISWFTLLLAFLLIKIFNIEGFGYYFIWTSSIIWCLWNFKLSKVEYTKDNVYFNNKEFKFESIIDINTIDFNNIEFVIFKTDSIKWNERYYVTEFGELGLLGFVKIIISSFKSGELPRSEFMELLQEKSNIDQRKFN